MELELELEVRDIEQIEENLALEHAQELADSQAQGDLTRLFTNGFLIG
jgi:hypothetical protein